MVDWVCKNLQSSKQASNLRVDHNESYKEKEADAARLVEGIRNMT